MSGLAQDILNDLYHLPKDRALPPSEPRDPYLQPLGYTIYRTRYHPSSNAPWSHLQHSLSQEFHNAISTADPSPALVSKLLSLVLLDFRSDPELLHLVICKFVAGVRMAG